MHIFASFVLLATLASKRSLAARTRHQKNIGLVRSISPPQSVEEGGSVELQCRIGKIPDRAEVAWVKLRGLGDVEYMSIFRKGEGVIDYEDDFNSEMDEDDEEYVWSLTLYKVTKSMAAFYQCEVSPLKRFFELVMMAPDFGGNVGVETFFRENLYLA